MLPVVTGWLGLVLLQLAYHSDVTILKRTLQECAWVHSVCCKHESCRDMTARHHS
jgi:hypothetical protein